MYFAVLQPHDLDSPRVVTPMPLTVDGSVFANTLPVHGRIQDAGKTWDLPDGGNRSVGAGIFQPNGLGAGGNDNHLAMRCDISRTAEPVFPGHTPLFVLQPILTAPAVAGEPHHLLDR